MENKKEIDFEKLDGLSDDEAILELDSITGLNDEIIEDANMATLISQSDGENLIYYKVEGLFKDDTQKAYKNRLALRRKPPVLEVRDVHENRVRFMLTENLVGQLIDSLEDVQKAYYGYTPQKKSEPAPIKDWPSRALQYTQENPLKIVVTMLAIAVIGLALFI